MGKYGWCHASCCSGETELHTLRSHLWHMVQMYYDSKGGLSIPGNTFDQMNAMRNVFVECAVDLYGQILNTHFCEATIKMRLQRAGLSAFSHLHSDIYAFIAEYAMPMPWDEARKSLDLPWSGVPIIPDAMLPSMATHTDQKSCGFSVYKGVLVRWDEDQDPRVLTFIDELEPEVREILLVVQEHEGSLALVWKGAVPPTFGAEHNNGTVVEGDYWCIHSSEATVEFIQRGKPE